MRRRSVIPALGLLAVLAGCGDATPLAERQSQAPADSRVVVRLEEPDPVVVLDGPWKVRDSTWYLQIEGMPLPQNRRIGPHLLVPDDRSGAVSVVGPLRDGTYDVRVVTYFDEPAVPDGCEDVVEATVELGGHPAEMVSRAARRALGVAGVADLRIRWCTSGLDEVSPATDSVAGRQLLQLWPDSGSHRPEDVRLGSRFARQVAQR